MAHRVCRVICFLCLLLSKQISSEEIRAKKPKRIVYRSVTYSTCSMSDKSELKAELERKKQRIAQIREEKKRKEEEKKKKDVSPPAICLFGTCQAAASF